MAFRLAEAIVDRCPDAVRQGLARVTYAVFEAERSLSKYSRSRHPRCGAQWKPGGCRRNRSPHRASASPEIAASSLPAEKMSCRSKITTPHPASSLDKKRAGGRRHRPKCLRPSETRGEEPGFATTHAAIRTRRPDPRDRANVGLT